MNLSLVLIILVAHWIGDFILQTDQMALNKSKDWYWLGAHALVYTSFLLWIAAPFIGWASSNLGFTLIAWVFLNGFLHFWTDALTSRITSKLWFFKEFMEWNGKDEIIGDAFCPGKLYFYDSRIGRHWFFVMIGLDQLIHTVTLFTTAWWLL